MGNIDKLLSYGIIPEKLKDYTSSECDVECIYRKLIREITYRCKLHQVFIDPVNAVMCNIDKQYVACRLLNCTQIIIRSWFIQKYKEDLSFEDCLIRDLLEGYDNRHKKLVDAGKKFVINKLRNIGITPIVEGIFVKHNLPAKLRQKNVTWSDVCIDTSTGLMYITSNMECGKIVHACCDLYEELFNSLNVYHTYIKEQSTLSLTTNGIDNGIRVITGIPYRARRSCHGAC